MSVSNVNSYASSMSTTAWWIAFAFTLTATVVFLVLSYIRNVKPEARLVRLPCCPRSRAPPRCVCEPSALLPTPCCATRASLICV